MSVYAWKHNNQIYHIFHFSSKIREKVHLNAYALKWNDKLMVTAFKTKLKGIDNSLISLEIQCLGKTTDSIHPQSFLLHLSLHEF